MARAGVEWSGRDGRALKEIPRSTSCKLPSSKRQSCNPDQRWQNRQVQSTIPNVIEPWRTWPSIRSVSALLLKWCGKCPRSVSATYPRYSSTLPRPSHHRRVQGHGERERAQTKDTWKGHARANTKTCILKTNSQLNPHCLGVLSCWTLH